ncbi:hypothetical protein [Gordoniibacillus kamchatkensis]|nr:hypothetical protein [Paenibacillus sp. VKM B-2647]
MMLNPYTAEKMYELERKEMERTARELWKWSPRRRLERTPVKKEVNDK